MKNYRAIIAAALSLYMLTACADNTNTAEISEDIVALAETTTILQDDLLTEPIKSYDEFSDVCSEEIISRSDNIKAAVELKNTFDKKEFKELFNTLVYSFVNEMPTSKLYNKTGCYLSVCSADFFDVASNQTSDVIQCFIFTKDLEEAGTIRFLRDKTETMSVNVNDSENGGTSIILEKLAEDKDKKYIILTNGMDTKLLDNENNIFNAGPSSHKLEINGD